MDGTTITVAEEVGLREGLKFARRKGIQKLLVEGDSNIVINAAFGQWEVPWHIHSIVQDIRMLAKEFLFVEGKHIFREVNFVADALAHFGFPSRILISRTIVSLVLLFMLFTLTVLEIVVLEALLFNVFFYPK